MKEISLRKIINYKKVKVVIVSGLETVSERGREKTKGERERKQKEKEKERTGRSSRKRIFSFFRHTF